MDVNSGWTPADETDRAILEALQGEDGALYAELLLSAPLLLPVLPEPGTDERNQLIERFPMEQAHILVFTSQEALRGGLGELVDGSRTTTFAELHRLVGSSGYPMAVNPNTPMAVYSSADAVAGLLDGTASLVRTGDAWQVYGDELRDRIRRVCLAGLASDPSTEAGPSTKADPSTEAGQAGAAAGDTAPEPDTRLREAVTDDGTPEGYLRSLVQTDVLVPTRGPVSDPHRISDPDFPWTVIADRDTGVIPVFSSVSLLDHASPPDQHRVQVPFVEVVASWPGERHALCFDPGSVTELIVPGARMHEVAVAVLSVLEELAQAD